MKTQSLKLLLKISIIHKIYSLSVWFDIKTADRAAGTLAVAGPKKDLVIMGQVEKVDVYKIDWTAGSHSRVKSMDLIQYPSLQTNNFMDSDGGNNVLFASHTVIRFNSDPDSPNLDQEYSVVKGQAHFRPVWLPNTSYLFFGYSQPISGVYVLYRALAHTTTDLRIFSVSSTGKTRCYGMLAGSTWGVASIDGTDQRRLFDYTNGYDGGSNSTTAVHTKSVGVNDERGFLSPGDERGYYVVTSGADRTVYTVKESDGSVKLDYFLDELTSTIQLMAWFHDTDFALAVSFQTRIAIVNFMDETKSTPATYTIIPNSDSKMRSAYIWEDKKVLAVSSSTGDRAYVFKELDLMPCSDLCQTCDGIFRKKCTSCKQGSSPAPGDTCACDDGFYQSKKSYTIKECRACSPLCGTCSGGAQTDCIACKHSYMELKGDGSCGCLDGKFLSGNSCLDCHFSCKTCFGAPSDTCTSCYNSANWSLSGSKCIKSCPQSNQYVHNENICKNCPEFCEKCSDDTGTCSSCNSTYILNPSQNACEKAEKPLTVKSIDYSSLTKTLKISFNQAIIGPNELNPAFKVELRDPQNSSASYETKHQEISLDDSRSRIKIKFDYDKEDQTYEHYEIIISEVTKGTIKAERDPRDVFKSYPITKNPVTYIKSNLADTTAAVAQGTSILITMLSLVLIFVSIGMAIIMIKIIQLIFFLLFIKVNLPSNAARFIDSFRKNIIDYFPTILRLGDNQSRPGLARKIRDLLQQNSADEAAKLSDEAYTSFCIPHPKFEENHQTCSAFINLGSFITQLGIFLLLKFILFCIIRCMGRKKKSKELKEEKELSSVEDASTRGKTINANINTNFSTERQINQDQKKKAEKNSSRNNRRKNLFNRRRRRNLGSKNPEQAEVGLGSPPQKKIPNRLNIFNQRNKQIMDKDLEIELKIASKNHHLLKFFYKIDSFFNLAFFFNLLKAMQLRALTGVMISLLSINPRQFSGSTVALRWGLHKA